MSEIKSKKNSLPEEDIIEKEDLGDEISLEPYDPSKISIDHQNVNLGTIIENLEYEEIRLDPEFQRLGDLWTNPRKSQLIESILLGLPLPSFYFSEEDSGRWEVVDGLQRLSTFKSFIIDKKLTLHGLEFLKQYEEKRYDDLSREDKRKISGFKVNLYLIKKQTPKNVKFLIFKKVNSAGTVLSPQEIRHVLNQGVPAEIIKELAESDEFKKATDNKVPSKRQEDRDFVNRFVAFYLLGYTDKYGGNLDEFMNTGMGQIDKLNEVDLTKLKEDFKNAMILSHKIFFRDAFRKRLHTKDSRKPISKALYDSISVNFAWLSIEDRKKLLFKGEKFKKNLMMLYSDEDGTFLKSISTGTASTTSVKNRFDKIKSIIIKTLNDDK